MEPPRSTRYAVPVLLLEMVDEGFLKVSSILSLRVQ